MGRGFPSRSARGSIANLMKDILRPRPGVHTALMFPFKDIGPRTSPSKSPNWRLGW